MVRPLKVSYTVSCSSSLRDAVQALADRRGVNVADLARSVLLVVPAAVIEAHPDPGEPAADDREAIILKSGPAAGRPWRRKPRLQVRMTPGLLVPVIRRALALALALDQGAVAAAFGTAAAPSPAPPSPDPALRAENERLRAYVLHLRAEARQFRAESRQQDTEVERLRTESDRRQAEVERLLAMVATQCFAPLADGVRSRSDALYVLGFPPQARPDERTIKARFRSLATIHHPDGPLGHHDRMSQLNAAVAWLRRGG